MAYPGWTNKPGFVIVDAPGDCITIKAGENIMQLSKLEALKVLEFLRHWEMKRRMRVK